MDPGNCDLACLEEEEEENGRRGKREEEKVERKEDSPPPCTLTVQVERRNAVQRQRKIVFPPDYVRHADWFRSTVWLTVCDGE